MPSINEINSGIWIGNSKQIDKIYTGLYNEPKYPKPKPEETAKDHTIRLLTYSHEMEKIAKNWFEYLGLFNGLIWNPAYKDDTSETEWLWDGETDLKCERSPYIVSLKEIGIPTDKHVTMPHSSYKNHPNSRYIFWMRWLPIIGSNVPGVHKVFMAKPGLILELIEEAKNTDRDRLSWKGQRYYNLNVDQMEEININVERIV